MGANLILTAGLPASGKSSFAAYAGKELGIPVIAKDDIKEVLFDTVGFRSYEEKTALDIAAADSMMYAASKILSCGGSVILDNNFEDRNIPNLEKLIGDNPCNVITVRFAGDIKTIYERYLQRDRDPRRHPGHVLRLCYPPAAGSLERETTVTLEQFKSKFRRRGTLDFAVGRLIEVDTTDFAAVSYPAVLAQIRQAMI
ncbi:MAG: AAA family ATPase [Spirochaetales bacterium]|nr:AAA family ATPase [Spirochaetales bacterium]